MIQSCCFCFGLCFSSMFNGFTPSRYASRANEVNCNAWNTETNNVLFFFHFVQKKVKKKMTNKKENKRKIWIRPNDHVMNRQRKKQNKCINSKWNISSSWIFILFIYLVIYAGLVSFCVFHPPQINDFIKWCSNMRRSMSNNAVAWGKLLLLVYDDRFV